MLSRTTALTLVLLVHGTCATDVQDAVQRRMQRRAGRNDGPHYLHSRPVKSIAFDEAVSQKMGGYTAPYTPPYAPSVTAPPYVPPPYVPPPYVPPVYIAPFIPYIPYVAPYVAQLNAFAGSLLAVDECFRRDATVWMQCHDGTTAAVFTSRCVRKSAMLGCNTETL